MRVPGFIVLHREGRPARVRIDAIEDYSGNDGGSVVDFKDGEMHVHEPPEQIDILIRAEHDERLRERAAVSMVSGTTLLPTDAVELAEALVCRLRWEAKGAGAGQ